MLKKHPAGLWVLFFTEMWERFGYYLMLGIFVLYMTDAERGGLEFTDSYANGIYGIFIAAVYLTPFVGGILADRFLGYRKSVVIGGLLMAAGYIAVGILPGAREVGTSVDVASTSLGAAVGATQTTAPTAWFWFALLLIIVGNGFFKPNISTIVGRLYPDGSPLKDAGYNIFYMGINIGAFVCNFVAAVLRNRFGWGWAFSAAGVGMLIGVVWFLWGKHKFSDVQDRGAGGAVEEGVLMRLSLGIFLPSIVAGVAGYFLSSSLDLSSTIEFLTPRNTAFFAAVIPIVAYYLMTWAKAAEDEKGPIGALLAIFMVVIVFWMIFHQNGNTLTLWARDYTDRVAGPTAAKVLETTYMNEVAPESYWANVPPAERPAAGESVTLISTELMQSINPFFIILFTPLVVGAFAWLRGFGKEPSTPAKIAWGLLITAASTLVMVAAVLVSRGGETKVSLAWLVTTYGVITIGELFLSPMGLSLVSKLAPARLTALMMGGWFLSTAIGNNLTGVIGGLWDRVPLHWIFWINFMSAVAAAGLIAAMVPWIRRIMEEHDGRVNRKGGSTT